MATSENELTSRDQSITDSLGRFIFEKVPPVGRESQYHDYAGATSNGELRFCGLQVLIVRAGETTRVELPTEKRTVVGLLAVPEGLTNGVIGFSPDVDWDMLHRRYVDVVLGEYPAGIFFSTLVAREWQFDTADKLTNIVVERHTIGR